MGSLVLLLPVIVCIVAALGRYANGVPLIKREEEKHFIRLIAPVALFVALATNAPFMIYDLPWLRPYNLGAFVLSLIIVVGLHVRDKRKAAIFRQDLNHCDP